MTEVNVGDKVFFIDTSRSNSNRVYVATVLQIVLEKDIATYQYLIGVDDDEFVGHMGNRGLPPEYQHYSEKSLCWWVYAQSIDPIPQYAQEGRHV